MKKLFSVLAIALISVSAVMAHPSRLYMVGDATVGGWSLDNLSLMVTESDGIYEWVGDLSAGELKFLETPNWMPSYGPATNGDALELGTIDLVKRVEELEGNDNKFLVVAGRYALHIDLTGETPQITVADGTGMEDKGFTTIYPEVVFAIGEATVGGWSLDDAVEMKETACNSGIFTAELTLKSGQLKFLHQRNWGKAYGAAVADSPVAGDGEYELGLITGDADDNKFLVTLAEEKTFTVTVDATANKMTLSEGTTALDVVVTSNTILVYDLSGSLRMVTTSDQLSTSQLNAGIYILKGANQTKKMIVK